MSRDGTHRATQYAQVLCLCGHRIVAQSWADFRAAVPARCEKGDCDDPAMELTRKATSRRSGSTSRVIDAR